jgi:hypothetical protein
VQTALEVFRWPRAGTYAQQSQSVEFVVLRNREPAQVAGLHITAFDVPHYPATAPSALRIAAGVRSSAIPATRTGARRSSKRPMAPTCFAAECLVQQAAAAVVSERHARWFADLVAESAAQYHGPNETAALERIEREHANVQAAFHWLLDQPLRRDEAVCLAQGL